MPEVKEIKEAIDALGRDWESWKQTIDQRDAEVKANGEALSETKEKLAALEQSIQETQDLKERLEKVEVDLDTPYLGKSDKEWSREQLEHRDAFVAWLRSPRDHQKQQELQEIQRKAGSTLVAGGINPAGGHAIPEVIARQIDAYVQESSPMRNLVRTVTVGTSDYKELLDLRGAASGWVGEGGSRTQTDTPALRQVAPTFGTLYAYAQAYEEAINDIFFDVQNWLVTSIGDEFARAEGAAIISGNGTNKPTGLLNTAPEATDDALGSPNRTAGALEYVPTGVSDGFGTLSTTSPENYPGDVFIDVITRLKQAYRSNAVWVMNKGTVGTVMKFKDSDGNYLWSPGLAQGQPPTIRGFPVVEMEDAPDIAANAHPVLFGDFARCYVLADLVGMRMTMDDNITAPGTVKWYIRRRMGGIVRNDEAVKVIKAATS